MDIEYMELEQLKDRENYLRKELRAICEKIENYNLKELERIYGKEFSCDYCRFNAVLDFSGDGWHNLCGNGFADCCTCCHSHCEKYLPDTRYTKWIKKHCEQISPEYKEALNRTFGVNLFGMEGSIPEEKWEAIKRAFVLREKVNPIDIIEEPDTCF